MRLLFAFLGSALMMLAFGFGITTDVENIRFAYLDLDQSPESRAYLSAFEGSRYFIRHPPAQTPDELQLGSNHTRSKSPSRCSPISAGTFGKQTWVKSSPGSTAHPQTALKAYARTS